jgi:penicillin-binding protein 1A
MPGDRLQCAACGVAISVSYPAGAFDLLKSRGKRFVDDSAPPRPAPFVPAEPGASAASAGPTSPTSVDIENTGKIPKSASAAAGTPTVPLPAAGAPTTPLPAARPPAAPTPLPPDDVATVIASDPDATPTEIADPSPTAHESDMNMHVKQQPAGSSKPTRKKKALTVKNKAKGSWTKRLAKTGLFLSLAGAAVGGMFAAGGYFYYSQDLPTIEALQAYQPPTVTMVFDTNGQILGEIYEQRRYVVDLEEIPDHVQDAFIAAEDANFWKHGGVDYIGIARAMGRNLKSGRMAQGASTITQQVTRNFLLTKDKKLERKIKEVILSWRIETAYTKEHILFLYLNEIYLGSQAYGVEAASRTYFGKSVKDITVGEAAMLAGLPQRPSDYSPHRHFEKAKARQGYVLAQMVAKGYISAASAQEAKDTEIAISARDNAFLEQAPHFTEHVRRYLVDKYGEEKVLNQGLQVTTTCDLDLQRAAKEGVSKGVFDVDQRMGFRRNNLTNLGTDEAISERRSADEKAMTERWAKLQDPAGRIAPPETSVLEPGEVYDGVILKVRKNYAQVGIGGHEAIIPIGWSDWVYDPNPRLSWRYRTQKDLTQSVDGDDDGKKDGAILRKGDVVLVKVEGLSTQDKAVSRLFKGTPGASAAMVAARLWQEPEVEAAIMSYDIDTGAVRAMVGGANFRKSQFNRVTQSRRQVGSTFKPIVYAAAIDTRKVTAASTVADAPLAFATNADFIWKPANYGHDYLGNITLRKALAMSRNTCTVRVLESIDPGMNDDVIYDFARSIGIGGPPSHTLPESRIPKPDNDLLCPWIREEKDFKICMDRFPAKDPNISNTRHRDLMGPDDVYQCRACDMSMGLGSASLTMEELMRAYSAFASNGKLVEPYYIDSVRDRDGVLLEAHEPVEFEQVIEPGVASITTWLLQGVVDGGTGYKAKKALELRGLAGKTGTTNDEKDAWFVGFTPNVITAAWVGFDQPKSLGVSSTGGRTALPIWIDYMREAAPKSDDRSFKWDGDLEWAEIDENTGRHVSSGGRKYPFLEGTVPESTGIAAGQLSIDDIATEL